MQDLKLEANPELYGALYLAQKTLLDEVARGAPLRQTLDGLVRAIERCAPGVQASVLLVEGGVLRLGAAPNLPEEYNRLVGTVPIGEGVGSCGTAAYRREPVIVSDIQHDPLWVNYREVAQRHHLGACWSVPILDSRGSELLGTFALYHHEPRSPTPTEIWLVHQFSALGQVAIEQHQMASACAEGERRFGRLADALEAIPWEADADSWRYTHISRRAVELLGYPEQRWLEEPGLWASILHPEDREATVRRRQEATRDYEAEYRVRAADGRVVWLRDVVFFQRDALHGTRQARGVMINISRQREAEQAREDLLQHLVRKQDLLKAVLHQMPEAVIIATAPDGRVLVANEQVGRILRSSVPLNVALEHDAPWQGLDPDGRPRKRAEWPLYRAMRKGETVNRDEMVLVRSDGSRVTLEISAAPVRDDKEQIVAGVAVFSDITSRKHAEAARHFLADAGSALVDTLDPEATMRGVAALAARDFADWCLICARSESGEPRCVALAHRDPAKARLASELGGLLPQPGGAPLRLRRVLATGRAELLTRVTPEAYEAGALRPELQRLVRQLGAESAMTVPMKARGQVVGAIVFGLGGDERHYGPSDLAVAEELARRAALALEGARLYREAQVAVQRREEFLTIAAHELKTPLTSLLLVLQAIIRQLGRPGADPEALRERALAGERQGARLARLINELLDVSNLRAGRMRLEAEELDLSELTRAVVTRFRDELENKHIEVVVHAPAPVPGRWDRLRLEQVITNLVSNAIKYGRGHPVRLALEADDERATLTVEDEGLGMDPELLARLFRPFERGVAAGQYGGLGLGLYITEQIVRAHGGTVRVRTAPGAGSTFIVELPRRPPGSPGTGREARPPEPGPLGAAPVG